MILELLLNDKVEDLDKLSPVLSSLSCAIATQLARVMSAKGGTDRLQVYFSSLQAISNVVKDFSNACVGELKNKKSNLKPSLEFLANDGKNEITEIDITSNNDLEALRPEIESLKHLPKRQYSVTRFFANAFSHQPKTMVASTWLLTFGFCFAFLKALNDYYGRNLNRFMRMDITGVDYEYMLAMTVFATGMTLGLKGVISTECTKQKEARNSEIENRQPEERQSLLSLNNL